MVILQLLGLLMTGYHDDLLCPQMFLAMTGGNHWDLLDFFCKITILRGELPSTHIFWTLVDQRWFEVKEYHGVPLSTANDARPYLEGRPTSFTRTEQLPTFPGWSAGRIFPMVVPPHDQSMKPISYGTNAAVVQLIFKITIHHGNSIEHGEYAWIGESINQPEQFS